MNSKTKTHSIILFFLSEKTMMNYKHILLILFLYGHSLCSQSTFSIIISKPYYFYIEDQNPSIFTESSKNYPTNYKLSLDYKRNFFALNGNFIFDKNNYNSSLKTGDVLSRRFFMLDFNYGKIFQTNNLKLVPFLSIGHRMGDLELLAYPNEVHEYSSVNYVYNRPYVGSGLNLKYNLTKHLILGAELRSLFYFEHGEIDSSRYNYYKFKADRLSLNFDINLGYSFTFKNKY